MFPLGSSPLLWMLPLGSSPLLGLLPAWLSPARLVPTGRLPVRHPLLPVLSVRAPPRLLLLAPPSPPSRSLRLVGAPRAGLPPPIGLLPIATGALLSTVVPRGLVLVGLLPGGLLGLVPVTGLRSRLPVQCQKWICCCRSKLSCKKEMLSINVLHIAQEKKPVNAM